QAQESKKPLALRAAEHSRSALDTGRLRYSQKLLYLEAQPRPGVPDQRVTFRECRWSGDECVISDLGDEDGVRFRDAAGNPVDASNNRGQLNELYANGESWAYAVGHPAADVRVQRVFDHPRNLGLNHDFGKPYIKATYKQEERQHDTYEVAA